MTSEQQTVFTFSLKEPLRLDVFLSRQMQEFTRTRIQAWIKDGCVTVNGKIITKTGRKLENNDLVEVHIPAIQPSNLIPEDIPLQVIFENKDVLLVDKPAGMVVHPAAGHTTGTLVHAALAHAPQLEGIGGEHRPGVVHRLDKNTSGLIIMAKNDRAHQFLQNQFRERTVQKIYLALVDGAPPTPTGRIEAPIGRDTTQRKKMRVTPTGKGRPSVSQYRRIETFPKHTLLEVHPETGRTHQIRVHLAFIGCPIAGDTIYGHRKSSIAIQRHFLHAARLTITLPGEDAPRTFQSPLPPELEEVLVLLRT